MVCLFVCLAKIGTQITIKSCKYASFQYGFIAKAPSAAKKICIICIPKSSELINFTKKKRLIFR